MLMRYNGLGVGHIHETLRARPSLVKTNEVVNPFEGAEEFEVPDTPEQAELDAGDSDEDQYEVIISDEGEPVEDEEPDEFLGVDDLPLATI